MSTLAVTNPQECFTYLTIVESLKTLKIIITQAGHLGAQRIRDLPLALIHEEKKVLFIVTDSSA